MSEEKASEFHHCQTATSMGSYQGWKRCKKCSFLWCPGCSRSGDQCGNCLGGELAPIPGA